MTDPVLHSKFPGLWKREFYHTGRNREDKSCYVLEITPRRKPNRIVQSVATPSEADAMVREHEKWKENDDA